MRAQPDIAMHYFRRRYSTPNPYLDHDPFAPPRPAQAAPPRAARHRAALLALDGAFAVADLETTGLSTATCEILEFAAVHVAPDGAIEREFSQVVRTRGPVPPFITRLTGITQAEVDRHGIPVAEAFAAFRSFLADTPVFFHNASFDRRFLDAAATHTGLPFANPTHCTLQLARHAWPELPSHKLQILARHVGAADPTHRALADVRSTVAVALAARRRLAGG
ncbi:MULTISPECIES: 3'-5' exonuclease [Bordetella]|uniref:3'-5' exonuclease n=1 Tax=Bordetella petrii TaxID=94624 RepID=A0ABT7W6B7_9BORD|nr:MULTISPECIES: 3'-5' exonuclease [Bordetella]MDM9560742.1 3'-5' exonuclease [Bordetella petrii]